MTLCIAEGRVCACVCECVCTSNLNRFFVFAIGRRSESRCAPARIGRGLCLVRHRFSTGLRDDDAADVCMHTHTQAKHARIANASTWTSMDDVTLICLIAGQTTRDLGLFWNYEAHAQQPQRCNTLDCCAIRVRVRVRVFEWLTWEPTK